MPFTVDNNILVSEVCKKRPRFLQQARGYTFMNTEIKYLLIKISFRCTFRPELSFVQMFSNGG